MKRLNLLKNFGIFAAPVLTVAPIILTSTSCTLKSYYCDVFDYHDILETQTTKNISHEKINFDQLLYGSKKNHNGNYVLFIGTSQDDSVSGFFASNKGFRSRSKWYGTEFTESAFYKSIIKASTLEDAKKEGMKSFGFYNFIDFFDGKFYDKTGHQIWIVRDSHHQEINSAKPFEKWTTDMITQSKAYMKEKKNYEWDDESVAAGDFIRNDDYAKAYRAMIYRGDELYPKNDTRKDAAAFDTASGTPKMVIFKDAKLVSIGNFPGSSLTEIETFAKTLVTNYKIAEDEKK